LSACGTVVVSPPTPKAVVESFFATLKTELAHDARWPSRSSAHRALAEYIDDWYNERRRHASLGNKTPAQFERELGNRSQVA
jgi:transposase InsO family protein